MADLLAEYLHRTLSYALLALGLTVDFIRWFARTTRAHLRAEWSTKRKTPAA